MILPRNPILQWLGSVHDVWNLRRVQLAALSNGQVLVTGVWVDDGPALSRKRYDSFADTFSFDPRIGKWAVQTVLWQRLEKCRKALDGANLS